MAKLIVDGSLADLGQGILKQFPEHKVLKPRYGQLWYDVPGLDDHMEIRDNMGIVSFGPPRKYRPMTHEEWKKDGFKARRKRRRI